MARAYYKIDSKQHVMTLNIKLESLEARHEENPLREKPRQPFRSSHSERLLTLLPSIVYLIPL